MAAAAAHQSWRGSLERLRLAGCPKLEPIGNAADMPRNAVIVLDHTAISDVVASTMEALTGAGFDNRMIVPELALDFFDTDDKQARSSLTATGAAAADSALRPKFLINGDKLRQKKNVLLDRATYRVAVQRVDQYDADLMTELGINPKGYDTRLYVLCALYFRKMLKRPTIIASSDPVVVALAAQHDMPTCAPAEIVKCGHLLSKPPAAAAVKAAPPRAPPTT